MSLPLNRSERKNIRLQNWGYTSPGAYFVTICTKGRMCYFGDIFDDKVHLSEIGKIAKKFWKEIPKHFNNVQLDTFVIMPNHIHGILILHEYENCRDEALPRPYSGSHPRMHQISPKPKSVSVIIGSYKSIVTRTVKNMLPNDEFAWQSRFYDRIICTQRELENVQKYIANNPLQWSLSKDNPNCFL